MSSTSQVSASYTQKPLLVLPSARKLMAEADSRIHFKRSPKTASTFFSPLSNSKRERSALNVPPKLKERPGPYPQRFPGSSSLNKPFRVHLSKVDVSGDESALSLRQPGSKEKGDDILYTPLKRTGEQGRSHATVHDAELVKPRNT